MNHLNRLPLLAILLAVPLLMAPAAQIPEKLTAGAAQWNTSAQSVEVPLAVHPRLVRSDGYFVGLCVMIVDQDNNLIDEIYWAEPIIVRGEIVRNEDGLVEIAPAFVPWDRRDGTFSGLAGVCVMAQVFDRNGNPVKNADDEVCNVVEIR